MEPETTARFRSLFKRGVITRAEYETPMFSQMTLDLGICDASYLRLVVTCHNPTEQPIACLYGSEVKPDIRRLVTYIRFFDGHNEELPLYSNRRTVSGLPDFDIPGDCLIAAHQSHSFLLAATVLNGTVDFVLPEQCATARYRLTCGETYRVMFRDKIGPAALESNSIYYTVPELNELSAAQ
jgi:hypothetical protein